MKKTDNIISANYRKIAIDVAKRIVDGQYTEGQKLFGRSMLASYYNVSPETIRKSIYILKDLGIVDTEKGSGIEIISKEKASDFIKRCDDFQSIETMRKDIVSWAKRQEKETADIIEKVKLIVKAAERDKQTHPFTPYEITITENSPVLNKTVEEIKIWQNTGMTVIAIKRMDDIILSPGPYASLLLKDKIYLIGTEQSYSMALNFIGGINL